MSSDDDYLTVISRDLEQMRIEIFAQYRKLDSDEDTIRLPVDKTEVSSADPDATPLPDIVNAPHFQKRSVSSEAESEATRESTTPFEDTASEISSKEGESDHSAERPDVVPPSVMTNGTCEQKQPAATEHICTLDGECEDLACCPNLLLTRHGSVRGVRNGVRKTMMDYLMGQNLSKNYGQLERDKVVVYTTSLKIIRQTWENCRKVTTIFETQGIRFERRDLLYNEKFIAELRERKRLLSEEAMKTSAELPAVFVNGRYFGGAELIVKLNECDKLLSQLKPFIRKTRRSLCDRCKGFQFMPCANCHGGKKSAILIEAFNSDGSYLRLRCAQCDSCGLVPCDACEDGYQNVPA